MRTIDRWRYRRSIRKQDEIIAEHKREIETRPVIEHRAGYEFAVCRSCDWSEDVDPSGSRTAAELLAAHVPECPTEMRGLTVPMWSIAWPYYWDEREIAHRERLSSGAPYGLEMAWRAVGSHTQRFGQIVGSSEKPWYLFPPTDAVG